MAADGVHGHADFDTYRPDIDGLRAVAVLGVVTYHLGLNSGGFVGVDIFFVISGFLITRILIGELASGKSAQAILARFYERRIRRILPALAVMCTFTCFAAVVWLFPEDLKEFGRSLQSVAVFIANFHFQRKTGYFDGTADEKPLLHTWSLAVEEQYYLLFPLALWMVWRWRGPSAAFAVCFAVAVGSLVYAEIEVRSLPEMAFFSTPARIWELLVGALLALGRKRLPATPALLEIMGAVGALLIILPYALYSAATSFPGLGAAIPVLGSALLIASGTNRQTVASRLLATPVLVGIGLISYSVYLWHWPLIVFTKYRFAPLLEQHTALISAALFVASLLLGYLSWRFVEQPFRRLSPDRSRNHIFAVQASLMLAMVLVGVGLSRLDGHLGRWPIGVLALLKPVADTLSSQKLNCHPAGPGDFAQIEICVSAGGASDTPGHILLWGDSHAAMIKNALARLASEDQAVLTAIGAGCPPVLDLELGGRGRSDKCRHQNEIVIEYLKQARPRISTVLLVARWPYYSEGTRMPFEPGQGVILGSGEAGEAPHVLEEHLTATLRTLLKYVDNVVLLAPFPEFDRPVAVSIARAHAWGHPLPEKQSRRAVTNRQNSSLRALENAVKIDPDRIKLISPLSYFCDPTACDFADIDGRPLFADTNHLNALGISRVGPLLQRLLATRSVP